MNNSDSSGLRLEQSANLPGRLEISRPDFLRVISRARLAAKRALEATVPLSTIRRAICGFSNKKVSKCVANKLSVNGRTSEFHNISLVCHSIYGSDWIL